MHTGKHSSFGAVITNSKMFNLSQTYQTKFESNKHTDSNTSTSKSNINMKRQVKISSITGVGISDELE